MIRLNLLGGMGNQLFGYAYARALSEEFGDKEIVMNDYFYRFFTFYVDKVFVSLPIDLKYLYLNENVSYAKHDLGNIFKSALEFIDYGYYHQDFLRRPFTKEKFYKRSARGKYQQAKNLLYTYYPHSPNPPKNKLVTDLFQSEKYFEKIKPILLKEFQVKTEISDKNAEMIKELRACNSVAVHMRRGDFLKGHWKFLAVCNEDYFQRGMDYIAEHVENPVFYIFSNTHKDFEWIEENYHFTYPVKYVDLGNPAYEDFRLMYNCKHFVISNSTFSWWGSYMSQNEGKIVVVPDIWQNKEYNGSMDIYRDDMVKIHVNPEENL